MDTTPQLKPLITCPFCKSHNLTWHSDRRCWGCNDCGCRGPANDIDGRTCKIASWQDRPPASQGLVALSEENIQQYLSENALNYYGVIDGEGVLLTKSFAKEICAKFGQPTPPACDKCNTVWTMCDCELKAEIANTTPPAVVLPTKEIAEQINIAYHGIRSHQSYGNDSVHLKRAHDAIEKAVDLIHQKQGVRQETSEDIIELSKLLDKIKHLDSKTMIGEIINLGWRKVK